MGKAMTSEQFVFQVLNLWLVDLDTLVEVLSHEGFSKPPPRQQRQQRLQQPRPKQLRPRGNTKKWTRMTHNSNYENDANESPLMAFDLIFANVLTKAIKAIVVNSFVLTGNCFM
ncbi:unnamed protein product [Dicrocoelium dendriticum]|nr:unnamed protein product [Dicrocoelium dendriticum]